MKKSLSILIFASVAAMPAVAETSVGVSIGIHQPGVYGRIDIGTHPPPPVVYERPVIIRQPRTVVVQQEPMYLYVPPGHQRNWRKHCRRYDACGQPVYFVQERWVKERYEEDRGRRGHKDGKHGRGRGHDRD